MKKTILVDQAKAPDGSLFTLHNHDGSYSIKVEGKELMSTRQNHSEVVLAEVICRKYQNKDCQVLVGGLGFGFTLLAVLANVSAKSKVEVVELMECVINWNKNPEFPLAHKHLQDQRVHLQQANVLTVMEKNPGCYDGIILDVDNGPEAFSTQGNNKLYGRPGLAIIFKALKRGGTVGVWSAGPSEEFERTLRKANFKVEVVKARARPGKGAVHFLYLGTRP